MSTYTSSFRNESRTISTHIIYVEIYIRIGENTAIIVDHMCLVLVRE